MHHDATWTVRLTRGLFALLSCHLLATPAISYCQEAAADVPGEFQTKDKNQDGLLKLDEMITHTYSLDEINDGYDDLRQDRNVRGVIVFDV